MDQSNRFREVIEQGGSVLGARANTFAPAIIELYGAMGLDFVWLDFEHTGPSPYDSTIFEELTRAAEVAEIELLVRIPEGHPPLVRKVLDAGVRTLLVPRVDTVTEVREAVEATRFVYDGHPGGRGMASGRSRPFGKSDTYVEDEDAAVCLGVMIEKPTAVEVLDEILAVPDLGFVFIGPGDLSVQMGHPGDPGHPDVREAVAAIEAATLATDVPLAGISHDPDGAIERLERGYQIVRIGGDFEATRNTIGERLDTIRSATE